MMRDWFYNRLVASTTLPAPSIFAGGALTGAPKEDRFLVYRMQEPTPVLNDGDRPSVLRQTVQVWVYDQAGSYDWIDDELDRFMMQLSGSIIQDPQGIACRWLGNSGELADDDFNRIVRNSTFEITGRIQ